MWNLETTSLGRIAIPPDVPERFAVFCTSGDYPGFITDSGGELPALIRERFGLDTSLTTCTQIHSATVTRARREKSWRECDSCDALWSDEKGVSLGIKVADCLPVTMIDPAQAVIANVHSGWRGAVQGITAGAIDAMTRETRFEPPSAYAYLGPSIRVCCFEVGEEVASQFDARFIDRSYDKPHVDLVAYTTAVLRGRGFRQERVSDSELCTRCDGSIFHSYRRQGKGGGRNLQVVAQ